MKKGYTLIELLFVISVLAMLTALAIPNFVGIPDKAKIKAAKDAMTQIRLAQTLYRQDYEEYYINKDNQSDLSGLSRYMQINSALFSNFKEDTFSVLTALTTANGSVDGYTMTAKAKDGKETPITATEAVLLPIK